ncbi:MAG: hypothetical protein H6732_00320 [Alphaproteobacteria bacterium]|nr:hypothetical protein [Alphaproteobacteria bacterium]
MAGRAMVLWALGWVLAPGSARAQDALPPAEDAVEEPASAPMEAPSWSPTGRWTASGPRGVEELVDVAVAADGGVLVLRRDGTAWASPDGGLGWQEVLGATWGQAAITSDDEAIRLDAEVRLRELLDGLDLDDPGILEDPDGDALQAEQELDDLDQALEEAREAVGQRLQADALQSGFFGQVQDGGEPMGPPPRAWRFGGAWLVGRADGLWRATEATGSWVRVVERPVTAVVRTAGGAWAVGGPWGLSAGASLDGLREVPGAEVPVHDLVADGEEVWAATDAGVLRGQGDDWATVPGVVRVARRLARTPGPEGALWLGEATGLVRTRDGLRFDRPPGSALAGVEALRVDERGRLLVASADGVTHGGGPDAELAPVGEGLEGGATGLDVAGAHLWVVAGGRAFRLRAEVVPAEQASVEVPELPPVELLVHAGLSRVGLRERAPGGSGVTAATWLLPQVGVEARWARGDDRGSRLGGGLAEDLAGRATLYLFATWTPPARTAAALDPEELVLAQDGDTTQVFVGPFEQGVAARSGARRVADHRRDTTQRIGQLVSDRLLLLQEGEGRALPDRVRRALRLAEIDAWLDVLTDGALTRYRAGRAAGGGG